MALPSFPAFIDVLDPALDGLYPSFSSQIKTDAIATVRDKSIYLAIVAMQANTGGTTPWTAIDISAATIRVSIDAPDLEPTQGNFYLNDGTGPTAALLSSIGPSNLQNALNGLAGITSAGGLTIEQIGQDFICTWNSNGAQSLLTATTGSLYPASTVLIANQQVGTSSQPAIQSIRVLQLPATIQSAFTLNSGSPATMNGVLQLNTPGMLARFDALTPGTLTFNATFQVDIQFPGQDPQTVLQIPVTVHRDVIRDGTGASNSFSPILTEATGIQCLFGTVTALSSGAGTLSGLATANGARTGGAVIFSISGVTNGWYLTAYTAQAGQKPDDYNVSTNNVIWVQFI
jgi:hypothetical protein